MAKSKTTRKRTPKHVLKLPDLEPVLIGRPSETLYKFERGQAIDFRDRESWSNVGTRFCTFRQPVRLHGSDHVPCVIVSLGRRDFVEFLMRYPSVFQNAARELSLEFARACEHVRRLGLEVTA